MSASDDHQPEPVNRRHMAAWCAVSVGVFTAAAWWMPVDPYLTPTLWMLAFVAGFGIVIAWRG